MKPYRYFITAAASICAVSMSYSSGLAHDFWLRPHAFSMTAPGMVSVSAEIGHVSERGNWPMAPERVVGLRSIGPHGIADQQHALPATAVAGPLDIKLEHEGYHLVSIETVRALSVLPADKFNEYLEEEGLTAIVDFRAAIGAKDDEGRERYSRRSKALIKVGEPDAANAEIITKPLGLTLEIVPLDNPMELESGEPLRASVLYRGDLVTGVKVHLIRLDDTSGETEFSALSDDDGVVTFTQPSEGDWMLHAVWGTPIATDPGAEFDTIFSSFSFGLLE